MKSHRNILLDKIKNTTPKHLKANCTDVELDNLDEASLIIEDGIIVVENEHGTPFGIEELSDLELEVFNVVLGYASLFDYVILTKDNEWLASGNQATEEDLREDIEDAIKNGTKLDSLVVVRAAELTFDNNVTLD